ncbi:class V lanthionine synthetase subunit LxmK [Streptomyces varsoviensis]|uniref:class V lanthionine synthetase subunit LxmK n=1 Tax=Streptomyces varsoviensis TaxID=67373 RepID=UPI0033D4830C
MTDNNGVTTKDPGGSTRTRYDSVTLDEAPEVNRLLGHIGLGAFDPDDVHTRVGRNDNWAGRTTTGAQVFVKRLGGPVPEDARRRFERILAFEELATLHPGALTGPDLLGHDPESLLVAFTLLPDARSGSELAADNAFDEELSRTAGRITGALHGLSPDEVVLDSTAHPMPPIHPHNAIPLRGYVSSTFGELETWRIIQSDQELMEALRALRKAESAVTDRRPIHADLRLDQFLLAEDILHLTDFEEFRIGDPARDVGGVVGEWLYAAMHGIPRAIGDEPDFALGHQASHEEILRHGTAELDRLRPRIQAFWAGYREVRGAQAANELRVRAAAYAGWHMFDRMLATAMVGGRVQAVDRACAGIGRTVLVAPGNSLNVLGLGDQR